MLSMVLSLAKPPISGLEMLLLLMVGIGQLFPLFFPESWKLKFNLFPLPSLREVGTSLPGATLLKALSIWGVLIALPMRSQMKKPLLVGGYGSLLLSLQFKILCGNVCTTVLGLKSALWEEGSLRIQSVPFVILKVNQLFMLSTIVSSSSRFGFSWSFKLLIKFFFHSKHKGVACYQLPTGEAPPKQTIHFINNLPFAHLEDMGKKIYAGVQQQKD